MQHQKHWEDLLEERLKHLNTELKVDVMLLLLFFVFPVLVVCIADPVGEKVGEGQESELLSEKVVRFFLRNIRKQIMELESV